MTLDKIRWQKELAQRGYERKRMSPELSEALRNEIRVALAADGGAFDVNVARRVYDLAIAARDMCVAATSSVKEAIDQVKDTGGPMESLDTADTPESQVQASESFGARLLRELMGTLPMLQPRRGGDDPEQLVHALAEARRSGMHDVAEQIEVKLFGRVLSGPRPVIAADAEGSFEHGVADGRAGALPALDEGPYHAGYLEGTTARYLDEGVPRPRGADGGTDEELARHCSYIEPDPESLLRGGSSRTATCICGWRGPHRGTLELAADDALTHERSDMHVVTKLDEQGVCS